MFKRSLGVVLGLAMVGTTLLTGPGFASAEPNPECAGQPATIVATNGTTRGTRETDVIYVPHGVTTNVYAGAGDDFICNGSSSSEIFGGTGHDVLFGDGVLRGEAGDDEIYVDEYTQNETAVRAYGGAGNDFIAVDSAQYIDGGSGNDTIYGSLIQVVHGGSGNDRLGITFAGEVFGDSGNDYLGVNYVEEVDCGGGTDTYSVGAVGQVRRCEILDV